MLARAKINLGLNVEPRNRSGFHPLTTIFAEIALADELTVEPASQWRLEMGGEEALGLSTDDNLIVRAEAMANLDEHRLGPWRVHLTKHIPVGAGLGGGSSDAGAWIRFRAERDPAQSERLWRQAADLGKDIPFFRHGGIQYASAYGECLRTLEAPSFQPWVVLAHPGRPLATATVYQAFDQIVAEGRQSQQVALAEVEQSLSRGEIPLDLSNQLERAAMRVDPALVDFHLALRQASDGEKWWLSGSGATYYILINDEERAKWLYQSIRRSVDRVWLSRIVPVRSPMERG